MAEALREAFYAVFGRCEMTDQEKQALLEKIATLAEMQGGDPALLWKASKECPQGHINYSQSAGDLCRQCVQRRWDYRDEYDAEVANLASVEYWMKSFPDTIQQQWRIGRQPKDMTDSAVLLLVIQAWIAQTPKRRSERIEWIKECQEWRVVFFEYEEVSLCLTVFRSHTDRTTAEALALLGVLEENWGDENG